MPPSNAARMMPLPKCSTLANTPARSSPKMKLRRVRRMVVKTDDVKVVIAIKRELSSMIYFLSSQGWSLHCLVRLSVKKRKLNPTSHLQFRVLYSLFLESVHQPYKIQNESCSSTHQAERSHLTNTGVASCST